MERFRVHRFKGSGSKIDLKPRTVNPEPITIKAGKTWVKS